MRIWLRRIAYSLWGCFVAALVIAITYRIATVGWDGFIAPALKMSQKESAANRH